jgi:hypothetical protein
MRAIALVIAIRQKKRIRPVLGPHAGKLCGIPQRLVRDLRHAHRMRGRARVGVGKGFVLRVEHVVLVVGAVDVFAVPAAGEVVHRHDAAFTGFRGEVGELGEASVFIAEAHEAEADVLLGGVERGGGRGPHGHAEALVVSVGVVRSLGLRHLGERSDLLVAVAVEVFLCVIDGHAAVDAIGQCCILHDGDPLVRAVVVLEVHGRCPVVAGARQYGPHYLT